MSLSSIMSGNNDATTSYKALQEQSHPAPLPTKSPRQPTKPALAPAPEQTTPSAPAASDAAAAAATPPPTSTKSASKKLANGHSAKADAITNGGGRYNFSEPPERPKTVRPDALAVMTALREIEESGDEIVLKDENDWHDAWKRYSKDRREGTDAEERRQRKVCL
jgi:hypothetical protein